MNSMNAPLAPELLDQIAKGLCDGARAAGISIPGGEVGASGHHFCNVQKQSDMGLSYRFEVRSVLALFGPGNPTPIRS